MKKVFIDGKSGTTGLKILDRLMERPDIEIVTISEDKRKNPEEKKKLMNQCDVVFLCLPDAAAIESAELIENPDTVVFDTSTAHRTSPDWAYGFPELSQEHFNRVASSKRIAVPGCHASGFIALIYPLVEKGIISKDSLLTCHSITGYSGGGKKMIDQYEEQHRSSLLDAPRQYGLTQQHKHLREMKAVCSIESFPIFCPIVSDFYSGMVVTVPLFTTALEISAGIDDIKAAYKKKYNGPVVTYREAMDEDGFLSACSLSGKDSMEITLCGNDERILLIARYDNLGKGASGAAIECMNIALGYDITYGLNL
jgi:N-acetyl-gamma-glutamyl-phosphate reductase